MLIQPVQPVHVIIKVGQRRYECQLVSLSDIELEISCSDYLDKNTDVRFLARYFRGHATIHEIQFSRYYFKYVLKIKEIQFQPGLLINTQL